MSARADACARRCVRRLECDAGADYARRFGRVKQYVDPHRAREILRRSFARRLGAIRLIFITESLLRHYSGLAFGLPKHANMSRVSGRLQRLAHLVRLFHGAAGQDFTSFKCARARR